LAKQNKSSSKRTTASGTIPRNSEIERITTILRSLSKRSGKLLSFSEAKALMDHLTRPLTEAAEALTALAEDYKSHVQMERERFEKEFPHKPAPRPVTVSKAKYDKPDAKPEMHGDIFPEITIGPREAAILARQAKSSRRGFKTIGPQA
jgi:hypothetical protein